MDFAEASQLLDRVTAFLASCGGAYANGVTEESQKSILCGLATGRYSIKEEDGEIVYFASFCNVDESDIEGIRTRSIPPYGSHGSVVYVTEAGNKGGRKGMKEMIQGIRKRTGEVTGATWHRPVKDDKFYVYPRQRGEV